MVPVAGQVAQKVWEVGAARLKEVKAKELHPGQVVPRTLMIQDTGHVSTVRLPMSSQLPFAKCASNAVNLIFVLDMEIWLWPIWRVAKMEMLGSVKANLLVWPF